MIIAYAVLTLCLLILLEVGARLVEKWIITNTAVSNIKNTDYKTSTTVQRLLNSLFGISVVLTFIPLSRALPDVLAIYLLLIVLGLYLLLRGGGLYQTHLLAQVTTLVRTNRAFADASTQKCQFAFYFTAPDLNTPTHVQMWQQEFDEVGVEYMVVLRERKHLTAFQGDNQPVAIFVEKQPWLAQALPKATKAVFYANNGQKNRPMISMHPDKFHIQLLHGDSDKPPSYSPLSKIYDYLFVAGQMAIDRYSRNNVHIPADRFRIVGRPQVRLITAAKKTSSGSPKTIAYMPTWRGFFEDTQFSSLAQASKIIDTILSLDQAFTLKFKPHPMSYKDPDWKTFQRDIKSALTRTRENSSIGIFCDITEAPFDLYNDADLLITDISSVAIDFLYSGKPSLVIIPDSLRPEELDNFPSIAASYVVDANLESLSKMVIVATMNDPMKNQRAKIRALAFGDLDQKPGVAFKTTCLELLSKDT